MQLLTAAVGKIGYYLPWSVASGIVCAVGCGLLSTLSPTSSTGMWVGFQIIVGVGRGMGLQMVSSRSCLHKARNSYASALGCHLQQSRAS